MGGCGLPDHPVDGDNLSVLRDSIRDEALDLISRDTPFHSDASPALAQGPIEPAGAGIGVFLTLAEPTRPMLAEAAGAGQYELPGFAPVPRIQIVTIAQAMALRDRAVRLPARRDDSFRRAAKEDRPDQGRLDL